MGHGSLEVKEFYYTTLEAISQNSRSLEPEGKPQFLLLPASHSYLLITYCILIDEPGLRWKWCVTGFIKRSKVIKK